MLLSSFKDVDIALFSAGGSISEKFGPAAVDAGTIVSAHVLPWAKQSNDDELADLWK